MNTVSRLVVLLLLGQWLFLSSSIAQEMKLDQSCGDLTENSFRKPIDYRTADKSLIRTVEGPHFPAHVERLERGNTDESPGGDISYTLRTFPNHARALMAMSNLGRKEKTDKPRKSMFTVRCWFQRAIVFRPDDGMVRMVYGIDLMKSDKLQEAIVQLQKAESLLAPNGNLSYNLGLAFFELGDYDKSLDYDHKAYSAGFTLPALKRKLEAKQQWKDQTPALENNTHQETVPSSSMLDR